MIACYTFQLRPQQFAHVRHAEWLAHDRAHTSTADPPVPFSSCRISNDRLVESRLDASVHPIDPLLLVRLFSRSG